LKRTKSNKIKRAPGARCRMSAAPLSRLKPHMDVYEFTAADEILAAYKMAAGLPVTRDPDLDIPAGEARPDAADAHAATRTDLTATQRQWQADLRDTVCLRVADAVLPRGDAPRRAGRGESLAQGHGARALGHGAAALRGLAGELPEGRALALHGGLTTYRAGRFLGSEGEVE